MERRTVHRAARKEIERALAAGSRKCGHGKLWMTRSPGGPGAERVAEGFRHPRPQGAQLHDRARIHRLIHDLGSGHTEHISWPARNAAMAWAACWQLNDPTNTQSTSPRPQSASTLPHSAAAGASSLRKTASASGSWMAVTARDGSSRSKRPTTSRRRLPQPIAPMRTLGDSGGGTLHGFKWRRQKAWFRRCRACRCWRAGVGARR